MNAYRSVTISLAIEEGLREGWVTEDVLESKVLSWAYVSA